MLHTYLSTQLFQEGENPQGSLRVVVSSSRKSVKDHYHNRDVARAEGGGTPQYTIHLGPDWKKKKKITRIPYTIKPSRRPSTRHRSRLLPQGSAVACNPGAGSRLQRYSLSRTPRRTAPRRPRGGPFEDPLSLPPEPATLPGAHACLPSWSPRPRPSNSRVDDGHEMHQPQHHEEHEAEQGHSLLGQVQQRHPPARWPGPARSGRRGHRCRGRRTRGPPGAGRGPRVEGGRGRAGGAAGVRTEGAGRACAPPAARRALSTARSSACARWGGCGRSADPARSGRPLPRARAPVVQTLPTAAAAADPLARLPLCVLIRPGCRRPSPGTVRSAPPRPLKPAARLPGAAPSRLGARPRAHGRSCPRVLAARQPPTAAAARARGLDLRAPPAPSLSSTRRLYTFSWPNPEEPRDCVI